MARKSKTADGSLYKLREWRVAADLTLDRVGEALGMTGQNYGKIERGTVDLLPKYVAPACVRHQNGGPR